MKVEKAVVINKPLADVFAYVTSGSNYSKWQGAVEAVTQEGADNTVGAGFTETRKFMGQELKTQMQITAVEANAKWAAKVVKGPIPYEVILTFAPEGGGAKMTMTIEGEPTGFLKLAEGVVASQLDKILTDDTARLKGLLEG
jgi:uncharacterized protein YndB with AHSA1/START domain